MAIFKDFLNQVTFEEVWEIISAGETRQETVEYRDAFQGIFEELCAVTPGENQDRMTIRFVLEEGSEWEFWFDTDEDEEASGEADAEEEAQPELQVYGFVPGDDEGYAIGMKLPEVIVSLEVDPETERDYTPAQIVANCIQEMVYTSTVAASAYGMEKDMAGGGLMASQTCMEEDIQNVDLNALRRELGVLPEHEDYKTKYGFLF